MTKVFNVSGYATVQAVNNAGCCEAGSTSDLHDSSYRRPSSEMTHRKRTPLHPAGGRRRADQRLIVAEQGCRRHRTGASRLPTAAVPGAWRESEARLHRIVIRPYNTGTKLPSG